MRKKKIENGLKPLDNLLKEQYRLQVKMIITMVGVSENTWNAWVRDVRIPQEEKKELFVKTFDKAVNYPDNFSGKTKEEVLQDIKECYLKDIGKTSAHAEEMIRRMTRLDKLLFYIVNQYQKDLKKE